MTVYQIPSIEDLLKAGAHFGHQKRRRHPKMTPYILTEKKGVHIINVEETQKQLQVVLNKIEEIVAHGGKVVLVGTKKQNQAQVKETAIACGLPYIDNRWLGGTLTNFPVIYRLIKKYITLKKKQAEGELTKYTKKEQLDFVRETEKMEKSVGGLETLSKLPEAIFVIDVKKDQIAVDEAHKVKVPVIALCDTNVNPNDLDWPIPANDDSTKTVKLILDLVKKAVETGQATYAQAQTAATTPIARPMVAPEEKASNS